MRRSVTWTFVLLAALAVGVLAEGDDNPDPEPTLAECQSSYNDWKETFDEWVTEDCYDPSVKDETVAHTINCESEFCVAQTPIVMQELLDIIKECKAVENFTVPDDQGKLANRLVSAPLDMCNECTELYADMVTLHNELTNKSCAPSALGYSCTDECKELTANYVKSWSHLLEDEICRPHSSGGCGNGGGISEGAVYDILIGQHALIASYQTLPIACEDSCMTAYKGWYRNWERVIDDECMSVFGSNVDFEQNQGRMAFAQFSSIEPTCTDKCMHSINDRVLRTFYVLPVNCRVAGPQNHFHQLRMNRGISNCDAEHATYGAVLSLNMVANVVVVLSIFSTSLLALYCLAASCKNFFMRGNRGLDILPNPLDWKRFITPTTNAPVEIPFSNRRPRAEDEEKLMGSSS